nr:RNA-directed DNA polymerase, eukaryota [Tanacetum cinerariifolium]
KRKRKDPGRKCGSLNFTFPKQLSSDQIAVLESLISRDEIRGAVWGCGSDKSPVPDGFTFEFFRKFWTSTFLPNRQILEGPFIINEILSRCNVKHQKSLLFKVDFAKADDSIRWDYMDDVLNSFGFGSKWRSWIRGCLSMGKMSILVNGSPTTEFQVHRGLKQGDPLARFLFILIMESLYLSFSRAVEAGVFKGGLWVMLEANSVKVKRNLLKHVGVASWFKSLSNAQADFVAKERIVWVDIEGIPLHVWSRNTFRKIGAKWDIPEMELGSDDENLEDLAVNDANNFSNQQVDNNSDCEVVSDTYFGDNVEELGNVESNAKEVSEDPFNIYDLLKKRNNTTTGSGSDNSPVEGVFFSKGRDDINIKKGGSILDLLDEMIKGLGAKAKKEWTKELVCKYKLTFLSLQETKVGKFSDMEIKFLWGNHFFDYIFSEALGFSGALYGTWLPNKQKLLLISVYAPQSGSAKSEANDFNSFISNSGLYDIQLEGFSFTWAHPSATKMSKLDRFLVSNGLLSIFPHVSALSLDRHLSDHRPILLREVKSDFGATPFRFYHS